MYPTIFTREKEELPRTDEGITIGIATGSVVTRQNNYSTRQFASWAFCHCLQAFSSLKPLSLCPSCELKKGVHWRSVRNILVFFKNKERSRLFRPTANADESPPTHPPVYILEKYAK